MQRAQPDDKSRHAGLRSDPLTGKSRKEATTAGLFVHQRVGRFEAALNQNPYAVADRLWVKDQLNPEEEKFRFSK